VALAANDHRTRVRSIRRDIVATGVILFVVAWAVIFGQLASGHDPGLASANAQRSAGAVVGATGSFDGDGEGDSLAPVTTRQF
jgi:hypothetical protein